MVNVSRGSLLLTAAFQDLFTEDVDVTMIACRIDMSTLEAGDTIEVKEVTRVEAAGSQDTEHLSTYSGVQTDKRLRFPWIPNADGYVIQIRQTADGAGGKKTLKFQKFTGG